MSTNSAQTAYTQKTILGTIRELWSYAGLSPNYDISSTLNSKYGVFPSLTPSSLPIAQYFGIGIGGSVNVNNSNLSEAIPPSMTDMDLYSPLPFRCVPIEQDLTPAEQALYRMRTKITVNGSQYFAYYLKLLTYTDSSVKLTTTNPTTNLETPYALDYADLTPTSPSITTNGVITANANEVNISVTASLPITGVEVIEAVNVLYNGDLRYAKISELGIYSGRDQSVTGIDGNGNPLTYTEAILAQLNIKRTSLGTDFSNPNMAQTFTVRLGSGDLLLV